MSPSNFFSGTFMGDLGLCDQPIGFPRPSREDER